MESKKVGSFITALRKEKGLTQKQLAERLNVTDKAVSRWETGKGYPDIEILVRLCEELDISLNELLSGKRLEKESIEKACEENVVSAYAKVKKLKSKNIFFIVLTIILIVALCVVTVFTSKHKDTKKLDLTLHTVKKDAVVEEISSCLSKQGLYSRDAVCTDMTLITDTRGNLEHMNILLNDPRGNYRQISIVTWIDDESACTRCSITVRYNFHSDEDGVSLEKLWEYIHAIDEKQIVEKYAYDKQSSSIVVHIDSSLHFTFPENKTIGFGDRQQLLKEGKILPVSSSEGMKGKYYESVITAGKEGQSCCSVYIER